MKELLKSRGMQDPSLALDIRACWAEQEASESMASPMQQPPPPYPPQSTSRPPWCSCGSCLQMPTEAECVCCGQQPMHCLSKSQV